MANDDNLRRGKQMKAPKTGWGPQPHGGALQPPPPGGRAENFEKARQAERDKREAVAGNFDASLEIVAGDLTVLTSKIMRKAARTGDVPDSNTMAVLKEFRMTLEAVNESRRSRGAIAQAEEFFASLDTRVQEAATRMANGPEPPVAIPA